MTDRLDTNGYYALGLPLYASIVAAELLVCTVAGAAWVLWFRERHSPLFLVIGAAIVVWSLASLGALLDGRSHARRIESVRLAVAVLALAAFGVWA